MGGIDDTPYVFLLTHLDHLLPRQYKTWITYYSVYYSYYSLIRLTILSEGFQVRVECVKNRRPVGHSGKCQLDRGYRRTGRDIGKVLGGAGYAAISSRDCGGMLDDSSAQYGV
jgi:hypothetical protein